MRAWPRSGERSFRQLDVALVAPKLPSALTTLRRLTALAGDGAVFFLRKAPDLRARVDAKARGITRVLDELAAERVVAAWHESVYEPEARLFGGHEAMAHVHAWFAADTATFLAGAESRCAPEVASLVILDDLFRRATDDDGEAWDAWMNVRDRLGVSTTLPCRALADVRVIARARVGAALDRAWAANEALANGLRDVRDRGKLSVGVRALLPFVAVHHWNRHAVGLDARARIAAVACAGLDPHAGLRGA